MCGITGFWSIQRFETPYATLTRMTDALVHRGPDDMGAWQDGHVGIAIGHTRLSVVDLSSAGHQPMQSPSGRFVMAFNGEIYNHQALRDELSHVAWRGHSDTETLLAAFEVWGVEVTLRKTVGMFAIALWDLRDRTLHLTRDRFGEKPLYYGWTGIGDGRAFVFGSELHALRAYPGFGNSVCRQALAQYMRFMYVPAPRSIYRDIYKLEPGCMLSVKGAPPPYAPRQPVRPGHSFESITVSRWWSLAELVETGSKTMISDEVEAVDALEKRLSDAIHLQSLADVPVGAFLSGGVDSSTIVALMQKHATRPVKTFTIGFEDSSFDESRYARAVAKHLGTQHNEIFVSAREAQAVISRLPVIYSEPFADSSQIPTHLVCAAARQHATVALSGDAGDELFGGYDRYFWGPQIWNRLAWMPAHGRHALASAISRMPVKGWDALSRPLNMLRPRGKGVVRAGDKAHKLAARLKHAGSMDALYFNLVSEWLDPSQLVRDEDGRPASEPASLMADPLPDSGMAEGQLRMMYRDSMTYLPDDILCKVDRAAMAASLETRVPFLDHRVAELAWRLPLSMKVRDGRGKWILRQVLYRNVPRELIDRPKTGFGIPVGRWLRGPLRSWAESLLDPQRLQAEGYFHEKPIQNKWREHLVGTRDHTASLWAVLMFQSWLESVS